MLKKSHKALAEEYYTAIQKEVDARWAHYEYLAARNFDAIK